MPKSFLRQARVIATTPFLNLDGTTAEQVWFNSGPRGIRLLRVYALYGEITQTVAGGSFTVGVATSDASLVAATNFENSKGIGVKTEAVIAKDVVAPNTTIWYAFTAVSPTQTGTAAIVAEYVYDE
jgi:hypothetical protein